MTSRKGAKTQWILNCDASPRLVPGPEPNSIPFVSFVVFVVPLWGHSIKRGTTKDSKDTKRTNDTKIILDPGHRLVWAVSAFHPWLVQGLQSQAEPNLGIRRRIGMGVNAVFSLSSRNCQIDRVWCAGQRNYLGAGDRGAKLAFTADRLSSWLKQLSSEKSTRP